MGKKQVRASRTLVEMILLLSRILRQQFELIISKTEHWEFAFATDDEIGDDRFDAGPEWHHTRWFAWGEARTHGDYRDHRAETLPIEIRAVLTRCIWRDSTRSQRQTWQVDIWMRSSGEGYVVHGSATLWTDGRLRRQNDREVSDFPPRKLAFKPIVIRQPVDEPEAAMV